MAITDSIGALFQGDQAVFFVAIMTLLVLAIILFACVVGAILFWFVYLNIKVVVIEPHGIQRWFFTRGRIKTDKEGSERLVLMRKGIKTSPPSNDKYILNKKTNLVIVVKHGDSYVPAKPLIFTKVLDVHGEKVNINVVLRSEFQKRLIWINEKKRQQVKFETKNFWDKYGASITAIGMLVIVFLILVVTFQYQAETSGAANAAADKIGDAMVRFAEVFKEKGALG